ncbi:glycosyltransferase family 4 protein [Aeromonas veronii]|uniref:glycosyltransferase family 4 protein n=1 Tax=Aeromonas veronii TaxID=654 RepID=UPI003D23E07D
MKKILICNISYLPEVGGVENSIRHLKDEYENLGYSVSLLVGTKETSSFEGEHKGVIKFKRNRFSGGLLGKLNFIFMLLDLFRKLLILRGESFELCISRNQFLTIVVKSVLSCPVVYVVPGFAYFQQSKSNLHGDILGQAKRMIHHLCDKLALQLADNVCVFSQNMTMQALHVNKAVGNKMTLTRPGVDILRFLPRDNNGQLRSEFIDNCGLPQNSILILCLGRLVKAKGFDIVIEALQHLPDEYKCIIVGDGPERVSLEEQAKSIGIDNRVVFLGKVSTPEKIYPLCDVFAMSSRYEPFGQTILEAMSCDLPIVAFEGVGITTATHEICSKYAAYCNPEAKSLADIIISTLHNYKRGCNREFVSEKYSWHQLATHVVSLK